jgi:putative radical SAM enzyme (TIGR03279 family)
MLLEKVNGHEIRDVLDYRYWTEEPRLLLELRDERGRAVRKRLSKPEGIPLGLDFETYLMDSQRSCANRCVFCFIDQLPRGMRPTLYYKDDDARLSFLQGNYITLTNLSEREVDRICALRISPLNVSVHASDPDVRRAMLRNPNAGRCMELMRRLADADIEMNCQIVLCPGMNDGDVLSATLSDLSALCPQVHSVSVVPVGITRYREGLPELSPVTREGAADAIRRVEKAAEANRAAFGSRVVYCSDELYLRAGLDLPELDYYEDFPQFENGVGMLRSLYEEYLEALTELDGSERARVSVATGTAAAPLFEKLSQKTKKTCYNVDIKVYPVANRFFGETVDVAGLLTGSDLLAALRGEDLGERLLISATMLRHGGDVFLDDVSLSGLSDALGVPVVPVRCDGAELLDAVVGR